MLEIKDLIAGIEDKIILKQFSLNIGRGEIHAIMGPNGAGKSTLAKVLAGHPSYEVSSGSITFEGEDILALDPDEKALKGLFMSFQYPPEIEGVAMDEFLRAAFNAHRIHQGKEPMEPEPFSTFLDQTMERLQMRSEFKTRSVNEGFSGGEKKRNEIMQMALLEPKLAILDETDSGLDIDALKSIAKGVNSLANSENAIIIITHYQRLLDYITPHFVHVMIEGRIVHSGGPELAHELEARGYDWLSPQQEQNQQDL
jgi:Fe-S cluster assembly ATP-binding protein